MHNKKYGIAFTSFITAVCILLVAIGIFLFFNTRNGQATVVNTAIKQLNNAYNNWRLKDNNMSKIISIQEAKEMAKNGGVIIPNGYGIEVENGVPVLIKTLPTIEVGVLAKENSTIYGDTPAYNNPVIPKGFRAIDTAVIWKSTDAFNEGVVIEDEYGNQYVWVPVDGEKVELKTVGWSNNRQTSLASTYVEIGSVLLPNEKAQYIEMQASVKRYGGFYVARFEAGSEQATANDTGRTEAGSVDFIGYRQNMVVYNMVEFSESTSVVGNTGAVYLCESMYEDNDSIVTTLTYGSQWDAILMWMSDDEYDVTHSKSWGNYRDATISEISSYAKYGMGSKSSTYLWLTNNTKASGKAWLMTTGSAESLRRKNIYDFAGNAGEWTMENSTSNQRIVRGGSYYDSSSSASNRARGGVNDSSSSISFRACIYIK